MEIAGLVADLLRDGISVRVRVGGTSMTPAIRSGDVITLGPLGPRGPVRGEVVVFVLAGERPRLVAHRVVGVYRTASGEDRVIVRGDNISLADQPLHPSAIVGRVTRVERFWLPLALAA